MFRGHSVLLFIGKVPFFVGKVPGVKHVPWQRPTTRREGEEGKR